MLRQIQSVFQPFDLFHGLDLFIQNPDIWNFVNAEIGNVIVHIQVGKQVLIPVGRNHLIRIRLVIPALVVQLKIRTIAVITE